MKRALNFMVYIPAMVLSLIACSSADEPMIVESFPKIISLQMQLQSVQSKAVTDASFQTVFEKEDAVGVYVFKRKGDGTDGAVVASNQKYTFDGAKWVSEGGMQIIAEADQSLNFYAYYPYDATLMDYRSIVRAVAQDQSTLAAYKGSELLFARNVSSPASETNVVLTFSHIFSLLEVRLKGDRAVDPTITVELLDAQTIGGVNLSDFSTFPASGDKKGLKMYPFDTTSGSMVYRVLLPEQRFAAQKVLLNVKGSTGSFSYKPAQEVVFTPNHVQVVQLALGAPIVP